MALLPPNRNKGSGFTNINRILQANQGNKLGQTVASGVQNQVNNVQNKLQNSSQTFNQKAQENRLDTDENKQQRDNVIGRFSEQGAQQAQSGFQPNMANFQASSGLQEQFNAAKNKYEQEKLGIQNSLGQYQSQVDANKALFDRQVQLDQEARKKVGQSTVDIHGGGSITARYLGPSDEYKFAENAYKNAQEAYNQQQANLNSDMWAEKIRLAEEQMNQGVEAERQKYIEEQKRINAAQLAPTDEELKQFEKFRAGKYEGPTGLENLDALSADAQNAEILGQLSRSGGGRQELLRRFVGGNNYTQGQKNLDSILLNEDPTVNQIRKSTRGINDTVQKAGKSAAGLAQELTNRAKAFGTETVQNLEGTMNPLSAQIDQQLNQIRSQEEQKGAEFESIRKAIEAGGLDAAVSKGLVNKVQADALSRIMPDKFLNSQLLDLNNRRLNNYAPGGKDVGRNLADVNTSPLANMGELISSNLRRADAQNVNRGGAADSMQETRMNALQRLLGQNAEFASPGADYVGSKNEFDFDTANRQAHEAGVSKLQALIDANRSMTANSNGAKVGKNMFIDDAKAALEAFKRQSKYAGYDPENQ